MTTAYRRDVHKGRRPRHDGTYVQRTHVPHVPGQRCTQCRPLPLSDEQRQLLAPLRALPFRAPSVPLSDILDRASRKAGLAATEDVRTVFDSAVAARLGNMIRRAQRGRGGRTRSE